MRPVGFPLASLALFVFLAVAHTWPLATSPGGLSRNDTADTVHHEWILAWDAHQLATDPQASVRCQHFLSRARHARVLRSSDRPGGDGRAAVLARRLAGPRLQRAARARPRADRLDDESGDGAMDRKSRRRTLERIADGVQRDDADAVCGNPGSAFRVLPARAVGIRPVADDAPRSIRVRTGRLVRAAGAHLRIPAGVHVALAGCRRRSCGLRTGSGRDFGASPVCCCCRRPWRHCCSRRSCCRTCG